MPAIIAGNSDFRKRIELATTSLLAHGRLYTKKPALSGFHVYYSSNPHHVAYNPLEDTEYSGIGIYIVGLLGEVWKIGSFEKLAASYLIDLDDDEREISEDYLLETMPPNGVDYSSCLAVRYRAGTTTPILAARVPLSVKSIEHISEDGAHYMLHANMARNSRGVTVAHGTGDLIACALIPAAGCKFGEDDSYRVNGAAYRPKLSASYIINGVVFPKTYEEAPC